MRSWEAFKVKVSFLLDSAISGELVELFDGRGTYLLGFFEAVSR